MNAKWRSNCDLQNITMPVGWKMGVKMPGYNTQSFKTISKNKEYGTGNTGKYQYVSEIHTCWCITVTCQ